MTYENVKGQRGRVTFTRHDREVTIKAVELGSPTLEESTGSYVVRCECFGLVGCGPSPQAAKDQLERIVRAHLQFIIDRAGSKSLRVFLKSKQWREAEGPTRALAADQAEFAYAVEVTATDAA